MTTNCNNYAVKYRADQEAKKFNETYMALYNGMYDVRDGIVSVDEYADKIDAALKGGFPIDYVPEKIKKRMRTEKTRFIRAQGTLLIASISPTYYLRFPLPDVFLDRGANVNIAGIDGWTPLMIAIQQSLAPMQLIARLISRTEDLDLKDKSNNTALDWAISAFMYSDDADKREKAKHIITMLVHAGAKHCNMARLRIDNPNIKNLSKEKNELMDLLDYLREKKEILAGKEQVAEYVYNYEL